jgi:hypothetical protein
MIPVQPSSAGGLPPPKIPPLFHPATRGFEQQAPTPLWKTAPPLQTSLASLIKESLVSTAHFAQKPPVLQAKIQELNDEFSWEAARIYALYNVIYQRGVATKEDLPKLKNAEKHLKAMIQMLSSKPLDEAAKTQAAKALKSAQHAIYETSTLIKQLQQYEKLAVKYDAATETWSDACYDPDSLSGPLQSIKELKKLFSAFQTLTTFVGQPDPPESAAQRVHALYQSEVHALEWMIEDWSENLQTTGNQEFNALKMALSMKDQDPAPLLRQLLALQAQFKRTARELSRKNGQNPIPAPLPQLQTFIDQARAYCFTQQKEIADLAATYDLSKLLPLTYGSQEWKELAKNRPVPPVPEKGWAAKTIQQITDYLEPANWSSGTKDAVYRAFALMQLSASAIQFYNQSRPLKQQADDLQKKVLASLPPELQAQIQHEGKELKEHLSNQNIFEAYEKGGPDYIAKLTHGNAALAAALTEALRQFQGKPSAEQAEKFSQAYILKQQLAASPAASPFHHLSISDWWQCFTTLSSEELQSLVKLVPEKQQKQINKEGKILQDHLSREEIFARFKKGGPDYIAKWARGNDAMAAALTEAFSLFKELPTADEARKFTDTYILKRQLAEVSDLKQQLGELSEDLSHWLRQFKAAKPATELSRSPVSNAEESSLAIRQPNALHPAPASKPASMVSSLFQKAGSFFAYTKSAAEAASSPALVKTKASEGYNRLKAAEKELKQLQQSILDSILDTPNEALSDEIAQMQLELKKTAAQVPDQSAAILELAIWMQAVEDKCYAVKVLCDLHQEQNLGLAEMIPEAQSLLTEPLAHTYGAVPDSLNLFLDGPPIALDKKVLMHLVLDIAGSKTGLEGGVSAWMISYALQIVQAKISSLKAQGICDDAAKQQLCAEIFPAAQQSSRQAALELFQDLEVKIEKAFKITHILQYSELELNRLLREEVAALDPGKTFFFSSGWQGHAIVYEVLKQPNQMLTLRIYNTGEGIQYFKRAAVETDTLFMPFEEIVDIPSENFLHPVLIASLRQLHNDDSKSHPLSADHLMNQILPELGGQLSDKIYSREELRSAQQSGTCSWLSLVAAFSQQLGNQPNARHFEFESQLKALTDFDRLFADTYQTDWQACNLLKAGIAAFSTLVEGQWKPYLSDQEREIALARLLPIQQKLDAAEKLRQKDALILPPGGLSPAEQAGHFPANSIDPAPKMPDSSLQGKRPTYYSPVTFKEWIPTPATFFADAKKMLTNARWYLDYPFRSSEAVKKQMIEEQYGWPQRVMIIDFYTEKLSNPAKAWEAQEEQWLAAHYKKVGREQAPHNFINANEGIKEFALKIPLDDPQFWQQLPKENAVQLVDLMAGFAREFVLNLVEIAQIDASRAHQLKASDYLTLYKLLRAADKAMRISGVLGDDFPTLYHNTFDKLFENHSLYFTVIEPEWAMQVASIHAEWKKDPLKRIGLHSFFDYESPGRRAGIANTFTIPKDKKKYDALSPGEKLPELDWVIKWISQPDIQQKIRTQYPGLANQGIVEQSVSALTPMKWSFTSIGVHADVLPPAFYSLGELSFLIDYVLTGNLSIKTKDLKSLEEGKTALELYTTYQPPSNQENFKIFRGLYSAKYASISPEMSEMHFQEVSQTLRDPTLKDLFELPKAQKAVFPPNQLVAFHLQDPALNIEAATASKLNLQQMRQLLALTSKRNLQIQQTLGYFKERPQLLSHNGYQDLFYLLLFDAGLLSQELLNPSFVNELAAFFKENIEIAAQRGNYKIALFLLDANRKCADIYHAMHPEPAPFLDSIKELHALLETDEKLSEKQRYEAQRDLVRAYSNAQPLTADGLMDLLRAAVSLDRTSIFQPDQIVKNRAAEIEARDVLPRQRVAVQQLILGPEGTRILNGVVHAFYPQAAPAAKWNLDGFPHVIDEKGAFALNLLSGELFEKNAPFQPLPTEMVNDPSFAEVFGKGTRVVGLEIQPDVFECKDAQDRQYRVRKKPEFQLERKFGATWYLKIPASALHFEPRALYQGKTVWRNAHESFIVDSAQQPIFRMAIENEKLTVHQLDAQGRDTDLVLSNLAERADLLKILLRVEDASHLIALQESKTGELKSIELPRYNLKFTIQDEKAIATGHADIEGYQLAQAGGIPELEFVENYLVLEKEGKQRILFPDVPFTRIEGDSLRPSVRRNTPENMQSADLMLFDRPRTSGLLEPRDEAGRLFLAKLTLWKHEYALAEKYLRGRGAQLKTLSLKQIEQLEKIVDLDKENQDPHPRATALRLKAFALLLKNAEDFKARKPMSSELLIKMLYTDYPRYLENLEYSASTLLSPEEELLILKRSGRSDPVIANRVRQLLSDSFGMLEPFTPEESRLKRHQPPLGLKCPAREWLEDFHNQDPSSLAGFMRWREEFGLIISGKSIGKPTPILHASLAVELISHYQMARTSSSLSEEQLQQFTQRLSGLDAALLTGLSKPVLLSYCHKVLNMKIHSADNHESASAILLKMVLTCPDEFPPAEFVTETLEKVKKSVNEIDHAVEILDGPILEKAKKLYLESTPPKPAAPAERVLTIPSATPDARPPAEIEGTCVKLASHPFAEKPLLADWRRYFSVDTPKEQASPRPDVAELFRITTSDSKFKQDLHSLETRMADFRAAHKERTLYTLKAEEYHNLHRLKHDLEGAVQIGQERLAKHIAEVSMQLNRPFADKARQVERQLNVLAGSAQPISFEEAILLFFRADSVLFRQRNPALTERDVAAVMEQIRGVLKMSTDLQQMQRLAKSLEALDKLAAADAPEEELQEAIQEVIETGSAKRLYDDSEHPEYLVFEYKDNKLLKQDQVQILDKLRIKNGKIGDMAALGAALEAKPGLGKSAVIMVLLSLLNADGQNLSLVVMPEALFNSMGPELQKDVGSQGQVLETIEITRETRLDSPNLLRLQERLTRAIRERKSVLLKSSSLQSLFLKYVEKWKEYADHIQEAEKSKPRPKPETHGGLLSYFYHAEPVAEPVPEKPVEKDPATLQLERELQQFQQIFKLFKESGSVIIDEVDTILDVLKSFHYTIGLPAQLDELYIDVVSNLYQFVSTDPELNQKIRIPFAQNPGNIAFTKELYDSQIKPLLSRALLDGKMGGQDQELQRFLQKLSASEKAELGKYLQGDMAQGEQILLKKASQEVQDKMALYKEEISELLPLTVQKKLNTHYGKLPEKPAGAVGEEEIPLLINPHLAIPYRNGDPSSDSQHGTQLEQENYTLQMVLQAGLTRDIIEKELARVKLLIDDEALKHPLKPLEELPSYRHFLRMSSGVHYDLSNLKEAHIDAILEHVNSDRALQTELCKQYILPKINVYDMQLDADSQLFGMLLKLMQGMSGTLWNVQTFAKIIAAIFPSATDPEMIELLWSKVPDAVANLQLPKKAAKEQLKAVTQIVEQIYGRPGVPNGSIIDAAGLFNEIEDPEMISQAIMNMEWWKNSPYKACGYHDKQGAIMVLTRVGEAWVRTPLTQSSLNKEELLFFFGQRYTTGANVALGARMTATVTVSRHTILRDLEQAPMRLRKLAKGQNVNFIISEEDREYIVATLNRVMHLNLDKGEQLTLRHLILYAIYAQSQRQGFDNYRSFKQKMSALLREKIYTLLLDPSVSLEQIAPIFNACSELFMTSHKARPFELYGHTQSLGQKAKVVNQDVEQMLQSKTMHAFRTFPLLKEKFPIEGPEGIEQALRSLAEQELKNLPDQLQQSPRYGKERAVQVQHHKLQEQQKEQDIARQQQLQKQTDMPPSPKPLDVVPWYTDDLFTRGYYLPEKLNDIPSEVAKIVYQKRPLIGMEELLKAHFSKTARAFDSRLACSLNLCPVFNKDWKAWFQGTSYVPAGKYQKELSYALAIEDPQTQEIKLMLIDENDADYLREQLKQDRLQTETQEKREVRLSLYHFASETVVNGKEGIQPERFKTDPELVLLKVQAKFFGGKTKYTGKELQMLEQWLRAHDAKALHDLFKKQILTWKQESDEQYNGSSLQQLFLKLGVG